MVKNLKRIFSVSCLFILGIFLISCDFINRMTEDTITVSALNHVSTEIVKANVRVKTSTYEYDIFGRIIIGDMKSTGSGVVFYDDGLAAYVLTNSHVVRLETNFKMEYHVEDIKEDSYKAELVYENKDYDLAILKYTYKGKVTVMELADANPKTNELVYAIGSPLGLRNIITAGKIIEYNEINNVNFKVIIHTAVINEGSSGSMLINKNYQIIGINSWGFYDKNQNLKFVTAGAVPVEKVREFLNGSKLFKTKFANEKDK